MVPDSYSNKELARLGPEEKPAKGVFCPRCRNFIPSFSDLGPKGEEALRKLGPHAYTELRKRTGCSAFFAKLWMIHPHVKVAMPSMVVDFMREVASLIEAGDESTQMESDDLLQAPRIYGGLTDEKKRLFAFTYFPTRETLPVWELDFSEEQIRQIADGQLTSLHLLRCTHPDCGCHFASPEDRCFRCDYEPQM